MQISLNRSSIGNYSEANAQNFHLPIIFYNRANYYMKSLQLLTLCTLSFVTS